MSFLGEEKGEREEFCGDFPEGREFDGSFS